MADLDLIYCERCDMSINLAGGRAPVCPGCGFDNTEQAMREAVEWCHHCGGNGVLDGESCPYCGGNGLLPAVLQGGEE